MRIHRASYHSGPELLSELQWLQALAAFGLEVPSAVPSTSGQFFETVGHDAVPGERQVDLLCWMGGEPMGAFWETASDEQALTGNFRRLGQLAARLHRSAH